MIERAKVNDSDLLASSQAGSRPSRRSFLTSLASAGLLLYVAPSSLAKAASAATVNARVVLRWNDAMLAAIPATRMPAPITNRAMAIVHTAIYDAWTPYTERALPTQSSPTRRPESERTLRNKSKAISYAARAALVDLYPAEAKRFNDLLMSLGYDPADTSIDTSTPSGIGNVAAQRVLEARRGDGSNQENNYADTTNYEPVNSPDQLNDPNRWQPLLVGSNVQQFLVPHWGLVRPFGLSSGSELRNEVAGMLKAYDPTLGPEHPSNQHYVEQHSEVLKLSAELDDLKKTIAEYWSDGPGTMGPPGHWNVIAQYVSRRDSHDLDRDVKLYFVLNNAMMDSGIAVWDVKLTYDSIRPISAIRFLYAGQQVQAWVPQKGTQTIDGATWRTYIPVTPPFAEFVSGHSAVSSAGAELLKAFTGSNYYGASWKQPAGASLIEPGVTPSKQVTLSWETFTEAAQQAGMSRLFGGIHISDGNVGGLKIGQEVAKRAWNKAQTYFNGD
jgi:hypothetical protein